MTAKLGEGGMGTVYAAEHVVLGRRAAIKLLLPSLSSNEELVQRFFNEARATATLDHPGLVQVLDYGHAPGGSAFLVMELLAGETIARRLARVGRLDYAGGSAGQPSQVAPPPRRRSWVLPAVIAGALGSATAGVGYYVASSQDEEPAAEASAPASVAAVAKREPAEETPGPAARQVWSGHYVCAQGRTSLALHIASVRNSVVDAVFEFSHAGSGATGSFRMSGRYDPSSRRLMLLPGAWIQQPSGYQTVGLSGAVSADGSTFAGAIRNAACSTFTVRRR